MLSKIINFVKRFQHELFLGSCVILIVIISYNLGQINSLKKTPVRIKESNDLKANIYQATESKNQSIQNTRYKIPGTKLDTRVVVSKNSDKYHYGWCSGAKKIKPGNKIWFNSAKEAESRGYSLAGNCTP